MSEPKKEMERELREIVEDYAMSFNGYGHDEPALKEAVAKIMELIEKKI